MKEQKERYGIAKTARILGVSRSGYYAWEQRKPSLHKEEDRTLAIIIKRIFKEHHGRYGSPRIWEEMKHLGIRSGRKRVERLMREEKLCARKRRKRAYTTDSSHGLAPAENTLNRNFHASLSGEKRVSDITYVRTNKGWLYVTVVLDLWDRKVIGWSMSEEMTAEQTCRALDMAVRNRRPQEGLIFHSDRGVQYCSEAFRAELKRLCPTVRQSMSRKRNCWDNACAESFFKTLKTELAILKKGGSAKEIKTAVFEYIETYYNRCRRHSARICYASSINA
jgi:transposase InsO family protein